MVDSRTWHPQAMNSLQCRLCHITRGGSLLYGSRDAADLQYICHADVQNHLEWSENCEQVALFHLDRPDLATSQHLLTCAELRAKQAKGVSPTLIKERLVSLDLTWAKWYIRQLGESLEEKRRPGSYRPPRKELPESLRCGLLAGDL